MGRSGLVIIEKIFIFISLTVFGFLSFSNVVAKNIIPESLVDSDGNVCVEKISEDGCNTCSLHWYWCRGDSGYSCTRRGCLNSTNTDPITPKKCYQYLQKSAFTIPLLEGEELENCVTALFPNKIYYLDFNHKIGFE